MTNSLNQSPSLEEVFSPRGIAIIGVSGSGSMGFAELVLMGLQETGFKGIYPVNPKYPEVFGLPCYPSVTDIPDVVDHVIVNIPAESSMKLLDQCAEKKVKSVHFFTAGFGESGNTERVDLEKEMLEKARKSGFRIIGPNCVGLFIPKKRVTNMIGIPYDSGPIAFLSQSGGHACNLPLFSASRGMRFSKIVSYGNGADVNELELLEYFAEDNETEIIAAYLEGIKDGRRFKEVLSKTAAKKPVVIYKGGKTEAGLRAAKGHTASMIDSIAAFEAVCRQANTIQVENMDEMIDVLMVLRSVKQIPKTKNIGLFGAGGGPSVLAGDEMEKAGLTMPGYSEETQERFKKVLPVDGSILSNPLDTINMIDPKAISQALEILGNADEVDMLAYHLGFHSIGMWGLGRFSADDYLKPFIKVMKEARENQKKPILFALRPAQDLAGTEEFLLVQKALVEAGFPVFYSLGQLALAMSRVINWNDRQ